MTRLPALALTFGLALSACADAPAPDAAPPPTQATAPEATAPAQAAAEIAPYDGPAADVTITPVGELMEYAEKEITVHPGQTVRLTFENTATSEAMSHNVVVLQQNASVNDIGQAAMSAVDTDYIPSGFDDQIIAHTAMSAPGETVTVEFTAPAEGDYTYICTFPGHYMVMQGTMHVVPA
ncbi:plastocyanin/azurin family copper-binding protein [Rubrivirga sp. S365]|uniref:Plastocyanin/azurin family copper-binding protein n=1 Tax=Rubrivirga litoralis TaxID=3075598 RepID=A0ABU3BR76_9BACT|nr:MULTISPECIES: plastocyanin/azurin family copper-binding protein [unclassified Rubrivirga]MDT0631788.1 plastocyanin/azurin family copper-binding protein [Rubrivirga sp. F394]MDT7856520.1 plastocyanin/azurin family copper-binding protein [Rubrivirga sp. S365]